MQLLCRRNEKLFISSGCECHSVSAVSHIQHSSHGTVSQSESFERKSLQIPFHAYSVHLRS